MKLKTNSVYLLFMVLLLAYFQLSNSSNPNNGHTGAPPTGNTCSNAAGGCHSGPTGLGTVTIDGLPSSVTAGNVYPITVTVERNDASRLLAGFQLVAQQSNNSNAGVLDNAGPFSTVQFAGGKYYFEHNTAPGYTGNVAVFTADWTAPASSNGAITMYACANLADDNSSTTNDCIVTTTATATLAGGGAISVSVTGTNVSCAGGNNGSATATATGGGGPPYSYAWSNGGSTATISNLTAGTYTVSVTNGSGGSGTGSETITQPPVLNVSIVDQENITCTNPLGSATALANGGSGNLTYLWSNGQSGPMATLGVGNHTVSVTDGNGCVDTAPVTITANTTPPNVEAGPVGVITCAMASITLNGTGSSTGNNIQYLWTTTNGNIVSGATTLAPVVNAAGTYTLTVTNSTNGCTSTDNTTVTSNTTPPTSNAGADAVLTCTTTQVSLNGSSSSQGANFTYLWTTADGNIVSGATTTTVVVNAPGTYCLKVTNTLNGCTATDCASVASNTTPPLANAGSAAPLTCSATQVTLNGSASSQGNNFSYLWTTTNGNIVSGATTVMPVVSLAAVYTLTVTNSTNGCTASASVTVTSNTTLPTASAGPNRVLNCNNTAVVLDGSASSQGPNFGYLWSGPGIVSGGTTPNPTVNAAGNYIILVTNTANGCIKTDTANVTQTPALGAAISASQNVACNGANTGSATAAGSGGTSPYAFAWSNNANTAHITNIAAGTYTVSITDADNCTATANVTITQPPVLNANASATGETSVGANNGTATANPAGGVPGYAYAWSNGSTNQSITGLAPGTYTVSVTDANNCTASQTVTVASFSCGGFGANMAAVNPLCNGSSNGSATATVTGGTGPFSYLWSNGGTGSSISGLPAGSYTVSVTDASGCVVTGNVSLIAPTALNLSLQQTNVACNGGNNGTATVTATGGTPGYGYAWSNGGTGASQNSLAAATYTVSVTDANGCLATVQTTIAQPPALTGNLTASGESGVNANDGTASVAMSGGVAPYSFVWTNAAGAAVGTTSAITGLPPGSYCVSATDANGCVFTGCAMVAQFGCTGQAVTIIAENVGCAGGSDGTAVANASGFQAPVIYAWSNGSTGSSVGNLSPGAYTVSVTGADGCQSTQGVTITEPPVLAVTVLTQNNLECAGGTDGMLTVAGAGGMPIYAYSWSNGATTAAISNLGAGSYMVIVSDANDCTTSMSYEITVLPDTEAPSALALDLTVSLPLAGTANITPAMLDGGSSDNCGVAALSLSTTEFGCANLGANAVTLTVTDAAGNTATASATVTVLDEIDPEITCPANITVDNGDCSPEVQYAPVTALDNCGNPAVSLTAGLTSGSAFPSGTTTVTWAANDGTGNTASCSFTVTVVSGFVVSTAFSMPTCNGDSDGTATATGTGGTAPYAYAWDDPAGQQTQTATGLEAGSYDVSVTDASGCVAVQMVQVTQPPVLVITVDSIAFVDGDQLGSIDVTIAGGTGGYGFEWTLSGVFYSNDEDVFGLSSDFYLLQVTDQSGCITELEIYVPQVVATEEKELNRRITVAPNPSSGRVFVNFDLERELPVNVQVFALSGKALTSAQNAQVSSKSMELDLTGAAPGVYLLRAIFGESVVVKRLVIGR